VVVSGGGVVVQWWWWWFLGFGRNKGKKGKKNEVWFSNFWQVVCHMYMVLGTKEGGQREYQIKCEDSTQTSHCHN
jgi:hypothetical protein